MHFWLPSEKSVLCSRKSVKSPHLLSLSPDHLIYDMSCCNIWASMHVQLCPCHSPPLVTSTATNFSLVPCQVPFLRRGFSVIENSLLVDYPKSYCNPPKALSPWDNNLRAASGRNNPSFPRLGLQSRARSCRRVLCLLSLST